MATSTLFTQEFCRKTSTKKLPMNNTHNTNQTTERPAPHQQLESLNGKKQKEQIKITFKILIKNENKQPTNIVAKNAETEKLNKRNK